MILGKNGAFTVENTWLPGHTNEQTLTGCNNATFEQKCHEWGEPKVRTESGDDGVCYCIAINDAG